MHNKVKRNVIQLRLNDDELEAFFDVKNALHSPNNSEAIRTMIADERLVNIAAKELEKGDQSVAQFLAKSWTEIGRSNLAKAVLGLHNQEGTNTIKQIGQNFEQIQSQLSGLLWSVTNLTNNVNQLSHVANLAKQEDPADADTWNWIINSLQQILPAIQEVKSTAQQIKQSIKSDNKRSGS